MIVFIKEEERSSVIKQWGLTKNTTHPVMSIDTQEICNSRLGDRDG